MSKTAKIYKRLHTAFAMSYAEVSSMRGTLERCSYKLRQAADEIDEALLKPSDAEKWYEIISKERDEIDAKEGDDK